MKSCNFIKTDTDEHVILYLHGNITELNELFPFIEEKNYMDRQKLIFGIK